MKTYSRGKKKKNLYSLKDARLPSNYLELLFDTIKQNWQTILFIGVMSLLFFLPTLGMMFWKDYYFLQLTSSTNYSQSEIDALKITSRNIFNIGIALGIVFASIGVSGLSRILLLVSREEGLFFFKDFNKGVKQNLKSNFVFFLIYGILIYLSLLVINNINSQNFLIYIPLAIVQTTFFPMLLVNVETTAIYSWKLKDSFRNSMLIYIKNFIAVFLFSLLLTSVLLLNLIPYIFLKYVILVAVILLIYPFIILAFRVYMNKCLDKDINKEHYPEIYKRGIFENQKDEYLEKVVTKFYSDISTFDTLKHDPYLDVYYYHLCGYVSDKDSAKTIIGFNDVWPKEAIIDSLNFLCGLFYKKQLRFLNKEYSALGLMQKERSKVVIVLAGGGYDTVCTLPEDLPVSVELFKKGFSVFSFKYPVKEKAKDAIHALKTFINLLFRQEIKLNIDMDDYMIIGFSAGGHLVAEMGTDNFGLSNDNIPLPKLLGLCYPVITMGDKAEVITRKNLLNENPTTEEINDYSIELHVDENYPNCFIWQCERDSLVPFDNSLLMVKALEKSHVDYRFEHFDSDVHGYGIGKGTVADGWLDRLVDYYLSLKDKSN